MKSRLEIYRELYVMHMLNFVAHGFSEDKASRKANIYAVRNTDKAFYTQPAPKRKAECNWYRSLGILGDGAFLKE